MNLSENTPPPAPPQGSETPEALTIEDDLHDLGQKNHQLIGERDTLRADLAAARLALDEARTSLAESERQNKSWIERHSLAVANVTEITTQRDAALADAERLRETVKNAPHAEGCVMLDVWPHNDRCTCWKSAALNPAEPKL